MDRINVNSSDISSIWYEEQDLILEIEFNSWWIYQYFNVPLSEFNGIMLASSHWKYFHANIKNNYNFSKI